MASEYVTPMLLLTGVSFTNHWYNNNNSFDWKILLEGAVATGLLGLIDQIPNAQGITKGIAWLAFVGYLLVPIQGQTSPTQNLLSIVNGAKTSTTKKAG